MLVSIIKSNFTFENFYNFVIREHGTIPSENLNNFIAVVTPDSLGNQK